MIQAAIILVIVATIAGVGFVNGKKWEKSIWQKTYFTLANQMTSMQNELNLKSEQAKSKADVIGAEITVIGKVSEVEHESNEKEINRRVELYLTQLANAGLQPIPKEGSDSNQSGNASPLSNAALSSFERGGKDGLFADLDRIERGIIKRLIKKAESAETLNVTYLNYLKKQEAKMEELRLK